MSDLRWCLGVARWCRLPRTPSRRNSENMAPRRSYWSGTPLVLDRGHTNFRELRLGEVRRSPLSRRRTIVEEGSPYRRVSYVRRYGDRVTRGLGASEWAEAKGWSRPTGSRPGKADAGVFRPS